MVPGFPADKTVEVALKRGDGYVFALTRQGFGPCAMDAIYR